MEAWLFKHGLFILYCLESREPFCIHVCNHSIQQTCYKQSLGLNPHNHEKNVMSTHTMSLPKTHEVPDQLHTGF